MNTGLTIRDLDEAVPLPVVVKRIKAAVAQISPGWIEAEINKVTLSQGGHYWFELAGGEDTLSGVMWRRDGERVVPRLPEPLAKGQKIHARFDRVDFYGPHGALRIVISQVRFVGEGELLRRRQASLERLKRDGLCDKKRPLPQIPRCIGLVVGRETEGQFDIVEAIRKRWPPARIKIMHSLVQGARAPEQLVRSLLTLDADPEVDVIALCRGGGSVQDLLAFDDEELCRIIANTETPVVAAIGHTRNRPNAYFVADAEAPVPLAAAELLVPAEADHRQLFDRGVRVIGRELERVRARAQLVEGLDRRMHRFLNLEPQRSYLQKLDMQLLARGGEFLRSSESALATYQQAITSAWQDLPRVESLDAPKARLLAVIAGRMQGEHRRLTQADQAISVNLGRVPSSSALDQQTARLERAARRHCEEQGSIVERLADSLAVQVRGTERSSSSGKKQIALRGNRASAAARRALHRSQDSLQDRSRNLMGAAHRHYQTFGDAVESRVRHIAALDPSARGFALIRTQEGKIVDTASALHAGQEIQLELHDGSAKGHIDHVATSKEEA